MTATITKLRQLRGLGIFSDFSHGPDTPEFRKYNLVYGFNGSGKTTLSRVLHSIAATEFSPLLPVNGELSIDLSDGTNINRATLKCHISPNVLVFNEDFINDNLIWQSGAAKPVFYIGTAQANVLKLLDLLQGRTAARDQAKLDAEKDCRTKEREFNTFKTDTGKLIAEELNLGRRYNATNVEIDYQSFDAATIVHLSDDERKGKKAFINRVAPAQDIEFARPEAFSSKYTIERAVAVCSTTIGGVMIEALKQHPDMTSWVKAGLDYHVEQSLTECLHCGQPLTAERLVALRAAFDDSYDDHVREIDERSAEIVNLMETLRAISGSLPSGEIPADLVDHFNDARTKLRVGGRRAYAMLQAVRHGLESKLKAPNNAATVDLPEPIEVCAELDAAINDAVNAIAQVIDMHNKRNIEFTQEQAQAREDLKAHHLSERYANYIKLRSRYVEADAVRDARIRLVEKHRQRLNAVRDQLLSHGPAVETVNALLKSFLGHGELTLTTDGDGYRIQRRGKNAVGPLSEGEKTAVAFCYYLTKLEEDGRKTKDVIAIVDDPISSLDTKALNYAFSLLKRTLTDTSQLIIMTHNLDFMNEAKKWLKNRAYPSDETKQPQASLFFISTAISPCGTIRSSSIDELPTLLREYDSEYQYLFSLIYLFTEGRADQFSYLMPNSMRKVLELFLAFKCPGSSGVESKLEQEQVRNCGIDPASLAAVARLTNLESHGDDLDDLITLPSMTVEESKHAAKCVFQLIEQLDVEHFKGMKKMARRANPAPTTHVAR